jgi:hypothetical protein
MSIPLTLGVYFNNKAIKNGASVDETGTAID